jgi:hypothetical protein
MSIAFVDKLQFTETNTTGLTTFNVPVAGIPAGALVCLIAQNADADLVCSGISDSDGNDWSNLVNVQNGAPVNSFTTVAAWSILTDALESGDTIVATWTSAGFNEMVGIAAWYTGLGAVPLDQQRQGRDQVFDTSPPDSGNVTTTQPDELIVGLHGVNQDAVTFTPTASFNSRATQSEASMPGTSYLEDRIVSAVGTYASAPTPSTAVYWNSFVFTFKQDTGPPGVIVPDYGRFPKPKLRQRALRAG